MTTENVHFHGSDLEKIEQKYHIPKDEIINYSGNVNPMGISPLLKTGLSSQIEIVTTYPDRDYTQLKQSIANYCHTNIEHVMVGNGSTELISLVIQHKKTKKALIIGPTYSEYEREITLGGGSCFYCALDKENGFSVNLDTLRKQLNEEIDLLVICNPNNPTSTAINTSNMRLILDHCKKQNIFVMIDETYVEFAENMEEITAIPLTEYYNNVFIIRGISKFFSAPGLRLGYGLCSNEELLMDMNTHKNPWTINTLASLAGEIMFNDTTYIQNTRALISKERSRIYSSLSKWTSIKVFKPLANFILIELLDKTINSTYVFEQLIQRKLMVRDCSSFPFLNDRFIRFCFLMPEQNDRLLCALNEILNHK
jgi:threonine-phosphate decarboxylase